MSLEANKIIGAVLLSGVLAMTAGYGARILSSTGGHGGHGGHHGAEEGHGSGLGKVIAIPETAGANTVVVAAVEETIEPVAPLLASIDLEAAQKLFKKKCSSCHTAEEGGSTKSGPNLWNVAERPIASVEGYKYGGLKEKAGENWTTENLNGFINKPKKWAPGTKMGFAGFKKVKDRAAVIAYLQSLNAN